MEFQNFSMEKVWNLISHLVGPMWPNQGAEYKEYVKINTNVENQLQFHIWWLIATIKAIDDRL